MKKIRIIEKFEVVSIVLVAVCLLGYIISFVVNANELGCLFYIPAAILGVTCFALEIWKTYLYDNLSKEEKEEILQKQDEDLYQDALNYISSEKFGHITRFQRRYGEKVYEKLVAEGYILDYPKENKWAINNRLFLV